MGFFGEHIHFFFPFFLLFNKVPSCYTTDHSQSKVNQRNHSARTQMVLFYPHKFNSVPFFFLVDGWFWRISFFPQVVGEGGDLASPSIPKPLPALPCPWWHLLLLPKTPQAGKEPTGRLGQGLIVRVWPRDCFLYGTSHHRELGGNDRFEASTIAPEIRVLRQVVNWHKKKKSGVFLVSCRYLR